MNEKTLYSYILPWSFRGDPGKFRQAFIDGLRQALEAEWVEPSDIARVLQEYEQVEFTATESKRMLGSMNDLAKQYEYYVSDAGGVKSRHLASAVRRANQTVQRNLEWLHSEEALKCLFRDKNRKGDEPPRREPEDHEVITRSLRKIGVDHTLHEIYGLFYGCAAAPTLVIWGQRDHFLNWEMAQSSAELCQEGRVVLIDDATHWVQHEEAGQVNRLIVEFLGAALRQR
jgi:pimeloyl-ACP methyl ester carboxylesterase